jgi:selenide,water dikinase
MTDVTGFGLLGHLHEMCKGSNLSATIQYSALPLMPGLKYYLEQSVLPDATFRNWNAYSKDVYTDPAVNAAQAFMILPDPQTNGGLLFSVRPGAKDAIEKLLRENGLEAHSQPIGSLNKPGEKIIRVLS